MSKTDTFEKRMKQINKIQQENKQLKEIIQKAINKLNQTKYFEIGYGLTENDIERKMFAYDNNIVVETLDILQGKEDK